MSERQPMGEHRIDAWLEVLASNAPTPGGGAFAALAAAAGASLIAMTARLTIGKERYAEAEARMQEVAAEADEARRDLLQLGDRDAVAFDDVMAAYRMAKGTEDEQAQRLHALQTALERAAEVPLMVARRAVYLMGLAEDAVTLGNPNAASDAMSGAAALYAATLAALANVKINAFAFVDQTKRGELMDDCARLVERAEAVLHDVTEAFEARIRGA
jgi:formiminotetrahydrofolate cyclodeaminase